MHLICIECIQQDPYWCSFTSTIYKMRPYEYILVSTYSVTHIIHHHFFLI